PPLVGVADLVVDRLDLLHRLRPGLVAHPREARQRLLEGALDPADQVEGDVLALAGEGALDVELAERVLEGAVGVGGAALPAGLELLLALEGLAVEGEALVDEGLREVLGVVAE